MAILIGDYEFVGPVASCDQLEQEPGICALLAERKNGLAVVELIDLDNVTHFGEDDEYVSNSRFWFETCRDKMLIAALYTRGMSTRERVALRRQLADEASTLSAVTLIPA